MKRLLFTLSCCLVFPFSARAGDAEKPVGFSADELVYDREMNLVIARGNVVFTQGDSTLRADHVNYDMTDGVVIASGGVEIDTPDGGLVHANYAKLSGDLKAGFIRQIRFTLADKSVLTANDARHINSSFTEFNDVAYSSCDFCIDGSRFWELRSKKLTHDKDAQEMAAQNATLVVKDVPVAYVPYFTYPDPTVKRRTGFLLPSYKSTQALDAGIRIPYYWEISPYTDFLFNPLFAVNGVLMSGKFRHNFSQGPFALWGSHIYQDGESRYNLRSTLDWNVNDVWRVRMNVDRVSDDTYLRRYDIDGADDYSPWLESFVNAEALTSRTYFSAKAVNYQNMRFDVNDDTIAKNVPILTFSHETAPSENGSYWTADVSSVVLNRKTGSESSRASVTAGWHLPGISDWGAAYSLNAMVRGDAYRIDDYYISQKNKLFSGSTGDFHTRASLKVSYPFVSTGEQYSQILEPIVMGVVAPNSKQNDKIPNLDSQDLDFDDTFLFSESRFVGYDIFEPGSRVNYGLKWTIFGQKTGYISTLIGQSYRFNDTDIYPAGSGLEDKMSDIVGRITLAPNQYLNLEYAFRLDHKTWELNRSEVSLSAGNALFRIGADYVNLKSSEDVNAVYNDREELTFWVRSALTRYWSIGYNQRIDLAKGGGLLEIGGFLRYEDECFALEAGAQKDYTYDQDYSGGLSFRLALEFKPFGGFEM